MNRLALGLSVLCVAAPLNAQVQSRPNIVFIMVDDLDMELARRLYRENRMPAIDAAFGDGSFFVHSYVTTAVCGPSRATFLTGQYAHNHGVLGNILPGGGVSKMDDTSTVATWLHDAGYTVGHIGKYVNGYGSGTTGPLSPLYIPPGYDSWAALTGAPTRMYNYEMNLNGRLHMFGNTVYDYQTDVLADLAVKFINDSEADDSRPFFLIVTPVAPHVDAEWLIPNCESPVDATTRPAVRHRGLLKGWTAPRTPAFNEADVSDKPPAISEAKRFSQRDIECLDTIYQGRAESMLAVDDLVAKVMLALEANGELGHTVLMFTSDNGYYQGQHRLTQKIFAYDEGITVPLIIKRPGQSRQIIEGIALNNDWAPTIADFAGVTPGHVVDGRSLLPLMANPKIPWRDAFEVEFLGRVAGWQGLSRFQTVRWANAMYADWEDGSLEYYDLTLDPYQQRSRHNAQLYAEMRYYLAAKLEALANCAGPECVRQEGP